MNQVAQLEAGGYTDAAEMLTLRAAIADYAQWSTTPLDFTMNTFHLFDSGNELNDRELHARRPAAGAELDPAGPARQSRPGQPALRPRRLRLCPDRRGRRSRSFGRSQQLSDQCPDHPWALRELASHRRQRRRAGCRQYRALGLPGSRYRSASPPSAPARCRRSPTILAAGSPPPTAGAPADGSALGFIAPAFATGAPGAVAFSGTDAVLLASATPQAAYSVTLTSLQGGTLGVADLNGTVIGATSGPSLTLSGTLAVVNTVLAHLTDTLQSGTDVVHIVATDSSGDTAVRDVGVQVSPPAPALRPSLPDCWPPTSALPLAAAAPAGRPGPVRQSRLRPTRQQRHPGRRRRASLARPSRQSRLGDGGTTLLAALAPSAYSTASLTVGGTFEVQSGGAAYFTGSLGARAVTIDSLAARSAATGPLTASGGGTILNNGTIEAVADQTLGAQRLTVANDLSGTGTLLIDPGATLVLRGQVQTQSIQFAANSIASSPNDPYSPSTLVLMDPTAGDRQHHQRLYVRRPAGPGRRDDRRHAELRPRRPDRGPGGWPGAHLRARRATTSPSYDVNVGVAGTQNTISFVAPTGGDRAERRRARQPSRAPPASTCSCRTSSSRRPFPRPLPPPTRPSRSRSPRRRRNASPVTINGNTSVDRRQQHLGHCFRHAGRDRAQPADPHLSEAEAPVHRPDPCHHRGLRLENRAATITVDNASVSAPFDWQPAGSDTTSSIPPTGHVGVDAARRRRRRRCSAAGTHTVSGDGAVGQILVHRDDDADRTGHRPGTRRRRARRRQWRRAHARRRRSAHRSTAGDRGRRGAGPSHPDGRRAGAYRHVRAERPRHWRRRPAATARS